MTTKEKLKDEVERLTEEVKDLKKFRDEALVLLTRELNTMKRYMVVATHHGMIMDAIGQMHDTNGDTVLAQAALDNLFKVANITPQEIEAAIDKKDSEDETA